METAYKRTSIGTYLQVEPRGDSYEERILENIRGRRLLKFQTEYENGRKQYGYDISALQPLGRLLRGRPMTVSVLLRFLEQLYETVNLLESYMLSEENLYLTEETVFSDAEEDNFSFCAVPGELFSFELQLRDLALLLLAHIDPKDAGAVLLGHRLYLCSLQADCSARELPALFRSSDGLKSVTDPVRSEQRQEAQTPVADEQQTVISVNADLAEGPRFFEAKPDRLSTNDDFSDEYPEPESSADRFSGEGNPPRGRRAIMKLALCIGIIVLAPGLLLILRGESTFFRFLPFICIIEIAFVLFLLLHVLEFGKRKREEEPDKTEGSGDAVFQKEQPMYKEENEWLPEDLYHESSEEKNVSGPQLIPMQPAMPVFTPEHFPFVVGRSRRADGIVPDGRVSAMHFELSREGSNYYVTDLNSERGTKVGGHLLAPNETMLLSAGEEISAAGVDYVFFPDP